MQADIPMDTFWRTLGRGLIKLLVSLLAAIGVGFMVFAGAIVSDPRIWEADHPPVGLFVAIAAGFITAAILLAIFFLMPSRWNRPMSAQPPREGAEDVADFRADFDAPDPHGEMRYSRPKPSQ